MNSKIRNTISLLFLGLIFIILGWLFSLNRIVPFIIEHFSEDGVLSDQSLKAISFSPYPQEEVILKASEPIKKWFSVSVGNTGCICNFPVQNSKKSQIEKTRYATQERAFRVTKYQIKSQYQTNCCQITKY